LSPRGKTLGTRSQWRVNLPRSLDFSAAWRCHTPWDKPWQKLFDWSLEVDWSMKSPSKVHETFIHTYWISHTKCNSFTNRFTYFTQNLHDEWFWLTRRSSDYTLIKLNAFCHCYSKCHFCYIVETLLIRSFLVLHCTYFKARSDVYNDVKGTYAPHVYWRFDLGHHVCLFRSNFFIVVACLLPHCFQSVVKIRSRKIYII
jgi:hypothetical protein